MPDLFGGDDQPRGADLHAREGDGPAPHSLALAMRVQGVVAAGSAADLVLCAAEPWSPETHHLFPPLSRVRAVEVMLMGHRLSREARFEQEAVRGTQSNCVRTFVCLSHAL